MAWVRRLALLLAACGGAAPAPAPVEVADLEPTPVQERPAVRCTDPITGLWVAHTHFDDGWALDTMELTHAPGDRAGRLRSQYESHQWNGTVEEPVPPPCREGLQHTVAISSGEGSYQGDRIQVRGTRMIETRAECGEPIEQMLGSLWGVHDRERDELVFAFAAGAWAGVELRWRRVECRD